MNFYISPFAGFEDEKPWLNSVSGDRNDEKTPEVALRRTQSFEADDKLVLWLCIFSFFFFFSVLLHSLTVAKPI